MKTGRRMFGMGAAAAACCALGVFAFAGDQDKKGKDAHSHGQDGHKHAEHASGAPDMDAMMAKWAAHATPGAHHQFMSNWVGEWDLLVKSWWGPDMPAEESKSTSSAKMIMGGRYLAEEVHGSFDMGGQPMEFEGYALMGFDNAKQKYFSLWIDSMTTSVMEEWGGPSTDGKSIVTMGKAYDPMEGKTHESKSVTTITGEDTRSLAMFKKTEDGQWFKHMEITYTRKK